MDYILYVGKDGELIFVVSVAEVPAIFSKDYLSLIHTMKVAVSGIQSGKILDLCKVSIGVSLRISMY